MSRGNSIGGVGGIGWQEVMAPEAKFVCSLVRSLAKEKKFKKNPRELVIIL